MNHIDLAYRAGRMQEVVTVELNFFIANRSQASGPLLCAPAQVLEFTRLFFPKITLGLYCEDLSPRLLSIWNGLNRSMGVCGTDDRFVSGLPGGLACGIFASRPDLDFGSSS